MTASSLAFVVAAVASVAPARLRTTYAVEIEPFIGKRPIVAMQSHRARVPASDTIVVARIDPAPVVMPIVAWRIEGDAIAPLEEPFGVAAIDGQIRLGVRHGGLARLHALVGPPINRDVSTAVLAYDGIFFGCAAATQTHGLVFGNDGIARAASDPAASDLYVSGPRCQANSMMDAPSAYDSAEREPVLHAPFGAIALVAPGEGAFTRVSARSWRNAATSFAGTLGDVLLVRTRNGATVKIATRGAAPRQLDVSYAVAQAGSDFWDVAETETEREESSRLRDRLPAATAPPARGEPPLVTR